MFLDWRGRPWAVIGQRSPDREEAPQLRLRHHPRLCTCWAWRRRSVKLMISGQGEDDTPPLSPKLALQARGRRTTRVKPSRPSPIKAQLAGSGTPCTEAVNLNTLMALVEPES